MVEVVRFSDWRQRRDALADKPLEQPTHEAADGVTEFAEAAGTAGASGPDLERERQEVRGALHEFVFSDDEGWLLFEAAAADGQIGLPERALHLAGVLRERGRARGIPVHVLKDALEALIPELAAELLPDSPAASWEWLLGRIRAGEVPQDDPSGAVQRLAAADPRFFRMLTRVALQKPDQTRLVGAARKIWAALRDRGRRHEPRAFSDHVWIAVREMFPTLPGSEWDEEWGAKIRADASADTLRHLRAAGLFPGDIDLSGYVLCLGEARDAESHGDRSAFREAARQAVREGRRAVREASSGSTSD